MTEETKKIFDEIIGYYGKTNQIEMIIEECSELILALQKLKRNINEFDNLPYSVRKTDVQRELADVLIMVLQGFIIFDYEKCEEVHSQKIERVLNRIEKEKGINESI